MQSPQYSIAFVVTSHASTGGGRTSCSEVIVIFLVREGLLGGRLHLVTVLLEEGLVDVGLGGSKSGGGDELL